MIRDEERREVARRLRSFVTDASVYADVDACRVLHSIGLFYKDIDRIYFSGFDVARLADLIEPSCDRDALLALADEIVAIAGTYPKKGSTSPLLIRFARRIREACGEVVA